MEQTIKQRIADIQQGNVPAGYRKTNSSVMPIDWKVEILGSIFTARDERVDNTTDTPLFSLTIENGITEKTERYEREFLVKKEKNYKKVYPGDFVYNPMNLRFGAIARYHGSAPCSVSGYYDVFCIKNPSYFGDFIEKLLQSDILLKEYSNAATGSLIEKQRVHFSNFCKISFIQPPESEITKLSAILGCCDRVIALKKELIAEKKKQKKALMQKLLNPESGFRLPGFSGEWKKTTLGDLATKKGEYGINAPACEYAPGLPRYIRITDIDEHCKFITSNEAYVKISEYQDFLLKPSDIIFVRTGGTVGKSYAYDSNDGDLVFAGFLIRFNFQSPKADSRFIKQIVSTEEYQRWVNIMSARSGQPGINAEEYASYSFMAPSLQEQQAIVDILSAADKEIDLLEQELAQQEQKKKSLMQLLLTGIVRV